MRKLELKNLNVNVLTEKEQSAVKGGFTTIGKRCKLKKAIRKGLKDSPYDEIA